MDAQNENLELDAVRNVLDGFTFGEFNAAKDYILNAPKQIQTRYRQQIEEMLEKYSTLPIL